MRTLLTIGIFLTLLAPVFGLGNEALEVPRGQTEPKALIGSELSNGELSEITGQGLGGSFTEPERESVRIILWDETKPETILFSSEGLNETSLTLHN